MYRFLKTAHSDKIEAYRIQDEYAIKKGRKQ